MMAMDKVRSPVTVGLVLGESLLSFLQGTNERLPRPAQGKTIFTVRIVRVELDHHCFPFDLGLVS